MIGSDAKPPRILPSTAPQIFHPSDSLLRDSSQILRKRKRSDSADGEHLRKAKDVGGDIPKMEGPICSKEQKSEVRMTGIRTPSFVYPKTAYNGHVPLMPRYSEKSVLQDILVGSVGPDSHKTLSNS